MTSEPRPRADHRRSHPHAAVWSDQDAGPLLRGYMVTGGRTPISGDDPGPGTYVRATGTADAGTALHREYHALLDACRHPTPVSELATTLGLSIGVLRVLLGDLLERQLVVVHDQRSAPSATPLNDDVLEAVVRRLRGL